MRLTTVADPLGVWGRAAHAARRGAGAAADRTETAAIELLGRALASARAEEALDVVLRSPLADRAVRSIVEGPLVEVGVRTALERGVVERIASELVDSGAIDHVVDHVLETPLPQHVVDRLLAGEELWQVVDEIARSESVTTAITQQSAGFADQVAGEVGRRSRRADDRLDRAARRLLHRREPPLHPEPS
jgi:hypothetical protein